jgi:hypothetical protein
MLGRLIFDKRSTIAGLTLSMKSSLLTSMAILSTRILLSLSLLTKSAVVEAKRITLAAAAAACSPAFRLTEEARFLKFKEQSADTVGPDS